MGQIDDEVTQGGGDLAELGSERKAPVGRASRVADKAASAMKTRADVLELMGLMNDAKEKHDDFEYREQHVVDADDALVRLRAQTTALSEQHKDARGMVEYFEMAETSLLHDVCRK